MITFERINNTKSQITELCNLAYHIWHEYWVDLLSPEQIDYMINKFQSPPAVLEQIKNENYEYFFIKINNEKAGYFGLSYKKDYLFLSKFYIRKEFRHKKIGTQAFEFIKEQAKNQSYKKIILTVNKYNTNTIKAYEKWDFKTIDAVVTDIGNGFVMDDYIMQYDI